METHTNTKESIEDQLLLEQYKQAAEEYRTEDRNTWQIFAIILALNGALVSLMKFKSLNDFSMTVVLSSVIGMCSTYFGIRIIARTALYQRQRVLIAQKIQDITGIHLYFTEDILDYMKKYFPDEKISWVQRGGGRSTMKQLLFIIGIMWLLLFGLQIYNLTSREVNAMQIVEKIELGKNFWSDDRGWGSNLIEPMDISPSSIGDLHVVSIEPEKVRGNHYHTKSTEWILIFGGEAKLFWRDIDDKTAHEITVSGLEPSLYKIPPNIEHSVINKDIHDIYLISFNDSKERGTVRTGSLAKLLDEQIRGRK